jgi:hypothetical protein
MIFGVGLPDNPCGLGFILQEQQLLVLRGFPNQILFRGFYAF